MLKLSRREEDFDNLSMFHQFFDETDIGRLLKKYHVYNEEDLRRLCLRDLSGREYLKKVKLTPEESRIVLYAIETGTITLQEYLKTYDGNVDDLRYRFFSNLSKEDYSGDFKQFLEENGIDVSKEDLSRYNTWLYEVLPKEMIRLLESFDVPVTREKVADLCQALLIVDTQGSGAFPDVYKRASFVALCIEKRIVDPIDLLLDDPMDIIKMLKFILSIKDEELRGFFDEIIMDLSVNELAAGKKQRLINTIIKNLLVDEAEVLLSSDFLLDEDIQNFYYDILYEYSDVAFPPKKMRDLIDLVRSYVSPIVVDKIERDVFNDIED